jgi:hypothetical protein
MKQAIIVFDDKDRHGLGCVCGNCNQLGHAYGFGVYEATGVDLGLEEERRGVLDDDRRLITRLYGPSEVAAWRKAVVYCDRFGYQVKE